VTREDQLRVALLRGINVGGARKVEMARLRALLERLGFADVRTYINSGNALFRAPAGEDVARAALASRIEAAIAEEFGFPVRTLVRSRDEIAAAADALPDEWRNDTEHKCDVMFLGDPIDDESVLARLPIKPELDEVVYVPGAVLWRVARKSVTRSGMLKIVGTPLYAEITVRNCNTLRKIDAMMRG
jgi:uncharacterized protein (DUF1697 family)